jgi:hypothetical protein
MISSDVFYKVIQYCTMVTLAIMLVMIVVNPVSMIFFAIPILITGYLYVFKPMNAKKNDLLGIPPKEVKK